MGKADENRQPRARDEIAAQQSAAQAWQVRQRQLIAGGSVLIVLVIVAVFIAVKSLGSSPPAAKPAKATVAGSVSTQIASVPARTLDQVGAGPNYPAPNATYPHAVQTIIPAASPLASGGKPQIVYVGAEYCPFCAAERWALAVALTRFGSFSNLSLIHSSASDVYPNTPTLSFYKSSYTSKYLVFTTAEAQTVDRAPLQPVTSLESALMTKYDVPPYIPAGYAGSYPFVDFGNKYVIDGASYTPGLLSGLTWQQVAADLANPNSAVGVAIDAAANHITAAICGITNNQPASVCSSTGVTSVSGSI